MVTPLLTKTEQYTVSATYPLLSQTERANGIKTVNYTVTMTDPQWNTKKALKNGTDTDYYTEMVTYLPLKILMVVAKNGTDTDNVTEKATYQLLNTVTGHSHGI
jgi:hypothetical protein